MISIIVPIYNAERFLQACIDSLIHQSYADLQIILVDDGSTDGSLSIAQLYAQQDARISVYEQPHAGQSVARNYGLTYAQGAYIAFADADDRLEPEWCAQHIAAIEGVDYVQSGYQRVRVEELTAKACLPRHRYQFTSPCMRLYRREAIKGLQFAEGFIYEDVLFSSDLWKRNLRCRMLPYAGYLYTLNPTSTTSVRRPEDERKLFAALRAKAKGQSCLYQGIIVLTIGRLIMHFIKS